MKFNCGPTSRERWEAKRQWHRWFAWHPVRVGSRDCRWLEYVERKCIGGDYGGLFYDYRLPGHIKDEDRVGA